MDLYLTISLSRTPPPGAAQWTQTARLSDLIWLAGLGYLVLRAQGLV